MFKNIGTLSKSLNPMNLLNRGKKDRKKDIRNFVIRKEELSLGDDIQDSIIFRKTDVIVVRPNLNAILSGNKIKDQFISIDSLKSNVLINLSQWDSIDAKDVNGEVHNIKDDEFKFMILKKICTNKGNIDEIKFNIKVLDVR